MQDDNHKATSSLDHRRAPRVGFDGQIQVTIEASELQGSGQNLSAQGVFFVAEGRVPVKVTIDGREGELQGEMVRIENMGNGSVGIAVKFDEAHADLLEP